MFLRAWRGKWKFKEKVRYYPKAITQTWKKCKKIPSKVFVEFDMSLK